MGRPPKTRITAEGRVCTNCKEYKLWCEYHSRPKGINNKNSRCRSCIQPKTTEYYQNNRTRALRQSRDSYDLIKHKDRRLKREYGITYLEWQKMLNQQNWKCLICGCKLVELVTKRVANEAVVDHCHQTNIIRGILCQTCNKALGMLKDNPTFLRKAADYLEKSH